MKITIVGGGSVNWTPRLASDLLLTPALSNAHYVLYDINKSSADLMKAFLKKTAKKLCVKVRIDSTSRQSTALSGADYIIITISTGGLNAMARDLSIPEKFSIYHTVGDTSGPGGWARAIRNFDVFVKLAKDINKHCPRALVLNYTNPMQFLTDVLCRICKGPVVGLCHGLFENLEFIKRYYNLKNENEIKAHYGGLNHFFWIDRLTIKKKDVLKDLRKKIQKRSMTKLLSQAYKDEAGFSSKREFATELFRMTGIMPYIGDRHTCEFFPGYITSKKRMKQYKLIRTSITDRQKKFRTNKKKIKDALKDVIPDAYLKRSRETAADIIYAHCNKKSFIDVGNMPNIGQISNLPKGTTVETAVRVKPNGFSPIPFGAIPESVVGLMEPFARLTNQLADACFEGNRKKALQSLRLDPVCSHLTWPQVEDMGGKLLNAHRRHIQSF